MSSPESHVKLFRNTVSHLCHVSHGLRLVLDHTLLDLPALLRSLA
jgi:hypothetical protein